jgi:predicted metalloprotease
MRTRSTAGLVTALGLAVAVIAGCSSGSGDGNGAVKPSSDAPANANPGDSINQVSAGGLPVQDGPSGTKQGVQDAQLQIDNAATDGEAKQMDTLAANALDDVFTFWQTEMPADFGGKQFKKPDRLLSYDASGSPQQFCGISTKNLVNAAYCFTDNTVAWDRGQLLPMIQKSVGDMGVVTVFAHEMGHSVQHQVGEKSQQSIVLEQQADCYAGVFMRWVAEGKSKHFQLSTGDGLNSVLAGIFSFRDIVGQYNAQDTSPDAVPHGLGFDRVYAFQTGFTEGAPRCAKIDINEINKRIQQREFNKEEQGDKGNVEIDNDNLTLLDADLDKVYGLQGDAKPNVQNGGQCQGGPQVNTAIYCKQQNLVIIDKQKLNEISKPPKEDLQVPDPNGTAIGDFGAFSEVASRYTLAMLKAKNIALDDESAGLRSSCLTGFWAQKASNGDDHSMKLHISPGDLDEAVAELLAKNSVIAADVNGKPVPSGFARVEAFRIGFTNDMNTCLQLH